MLSSDLKGLGIAALLAGLLAGLFAGGCAIVPAQARSAGEAASPAGSAERPSPRPVGLPNPATVACLQAGGVAWSERQPDGAERGLCRLASGQVCDQWAFFRRECGADAAPAAPPAKASPR